MPKALPIVKIAERVRIARCVQIRREIQQLSQAITQIEKEIPLIEEGELPAFKNSISSFAP